MSRWICTKRKFLTSGKFPFAAKSKSRALEALKLPPRHLPAEFHIKSAMLSWKDMTENLDECHEVVGKCVRHVGQIIKSRIWEVKSSVDTKSSDIDLVTETDQEVEKYLISTLGKKFPNHQFIGEESVADGMKNCLTDAPTWIIDPVDGTMNFVHGYPNVCVSIALLINKVPEIGIIYNPVIEFYLEARKGKGAKLNGKSIRVSKETDLSRALLGVEFGTSRNVEQQENVLANVSNLMKKVHGLRSSGSAAMSMALVAMGASDAYYEFGIHAWDVAAGDLLVREAGGVVIDPEGGKLDIMSRRVLCASTPSLANALVQELVQLYPQRD